MNPIDFGVAFNDIPPTYVRPAQRCETCMRVFRPDERFVITYFEDGVSVCECPFCKTICVCEGEPNDN